MTTTEQFCRILRERSAEHLSAGRLLFANGLYGQVVSILRQELDSMVRVIFLLNQNLTSRQHFIIQTLHNEKWTLPNTRTTITDRHMVNLADNLHGWTNSVYKLGCAFIHLSPMADYRNENPFNQLSPLELNDILQHLHNYHGFPLTNTLSMGSVSPYLLQILDKVFSNLDYYIHYLEAGRTGVI
ncbi:hypothetical protein [Mucilaginibacter sp. SJ]|uniref:hypothetical protein n=1 Tax=Mucilaginibacter sp. SJ TaxID=3029053 RepID=UPI0023A93DEF|nr:hypothetical protein [Mucilaginibacter sp. SJ]WEA01174.1 hypothetical protein MusilaSJ_27345 [Mucilaginibacter sp. SJ]